MKTKTFPAIVLAATLLFSVNAQAQSAVKDSVYLTEVKIVKGHTKKHIEKIHLDGWPMYQGLRDVKKIVSRVDEIPDGTLAFVDFYLNCGLPNLMKKTIGIDYKDTELSLVIYEVNPDGSPGKAISEGEVNFTVPGTHRGRFRIDVRKLQISRRSLYIGLMPLNEMSKKTYDIYVRFNEEKNAVTYKEGISSGKWYQDKLGLERTGYQFKMTVGIER